MFIRNDCQTGYEDVTGDACCSFIALRLVSLFQSRPDGGGAAGVVRSKCKEHSSVERSLAWSNVECARNVRVFK